MGYIRAYLVSFKGTQQIVDVPDTNLVLSGGKFLPIQTAPTLTLIQPSVDSSQNAFDAEQTLANLSTLTTWELKICWREPVDSQQYSDGKTLEINSTYESLVLEDNPYAYWRLNETSGTVAVDYSGNGFNGTYETEVQLANANLLPTSSSMYVGLNGEVNSYIDVSAASNFCSLSEWSIECWAIPASYNQPDFGNDADRGVTYLSNNTTGNGAGLIWGCSSPSNQDFFWYWPYNSEDVESPTGLVPPVGTLTHVVLTYREGTLNMYLNGNLISSQSGAAPGVATPLTIGAVSHTTGAMNGVIGEFAVYQTAIPTARIQAHYQAGTVTPSPPPQSVCGITCSGSSTKLSYVQVYEG